jgi:hypothetical protein
MAATTDGTDAIGAVSCTNYRRASRSYGEGRICAEPGCHTVLSIYNSEDHCARHAVTTATRRRRSPSEQLRQAS